MASVTVRELARNTTAVIQAIEASGRPALVTRNGRPVAALVPVNEAALEEWLLEHATGLTRAVAEEDSALAADRIRNIEWQRAQDEGNGGGGRVKRTSSPAHLRGSHRGE